MSQKSDSELIWEAAIGNSNTTQYWGVQGGRHGVNTLPLTRQQYYQELQDREPEFTSGNADNRVIKIGDVQMSVWTVDEGYLILTNTPVDQRTMEAIVRQLDQ